MWERGSGHDREPDRLVDPTTGAGRPRRDLRARGRRVLAPHNAGGCDPGSLGYASDRLHRLSGPGATGRRGSGDLSVTHHIPCGAESEGRARAVDVQLVLRLCDLPGPDRSLLGAVTRARVSERDSEPAPRRRQDPFRAGSPPAPRPGWGPTPPAWVGSISTRSKAPATRPTDSARFRTFRCATLSSPCRVWPRSRV